MLVERQVIQINVDKYTGDTNYSELGFYSNNTSDNNCCLGSQWMVCNSSKTYSISFWMFVEQNVVDPHVVMKCTADYNTYQYPTIVSTSTIKKATSSTKWYKYKLNFTPPSGMTRMQLCFHQKNHTENANYVTRIDQVMVIEGKDIFPSTWYSKLEEVNSNTTMINGNGVTVKHTNGSSTNLNSTALNFYDGSGTLYAQVADGRYAFWYGSTFLGNLGHTKWTNSDKRVVSVNSDYGHMTAMASKKSTSENYFQVYVLANGCDQWINDNHYRQGVTLIYPHCGTRMYFYTNGYYTDTYPSFIVNNSEGELIVAGDNGSAMGVLVGDTFYSGIFVDEISGSPYKYINMWGRMDMHWWEIYNTNIVNNVSATSAQTYALRTSSNEESYSDPTVKTITDIFSVQSPTEGDIRWSDRQTYHTSEWEDGVYEAYVEIPWWIAQNLENDYHVNITCTNGFFQYYVSERDPYYFIVRSDKDSMAFTFELCGKLLENNTTANNASVAGDQYLGTEVDDGEQVDIKIPAGETPEYPYENDIQNELNGNEK